MIIESIGSYLGEEAGVKLPIVKELVEIADLTHKMDMAEIKESSASGFSFPETNFSSDSSASMTSVTTATSDDPSAVPPKTAEASLEAVVAAESG